MLSLFDTNARLALQLAQSEGASFVTLEDRTVAWGGPIGSCHLGRAVTIDHARFDELAAEYGIRVVR